MNEVGLRRPAATHLALVGPTATGKSALALALARRHPEIEIVTVDSMQVYRGMDIGTAKPTAAERAEIPHHLLDVVDPHEDYTVARFQRDCLTVLDRIEQRGHRALLVGGTGLYLQAVTDGLDIPGRFPQVRAELDADPDTAALHRRLAELDALAAARIEPTNRRRVLRALEVTIGSQRPFSSYGPGLASPPPSPFPILAVDRSRPDLDARIERRYERQFADGFLDEVRRLRSGPEPLSRTARQALGYREVLAHLDGTLELSEARHEAVRRTRRFARRQQRWFRRDARIEWIELTDGGEHEALDRIGRRLGGFR